MSPAATPAFGAQALPAWKRAVLKVGSSLLADGGAGLIPDNLEGIARFVSDSHAQGRQLVIVSSGAVAAGRAITCSAPAAGAAMAERQAMAALGQVQLMGFWQRFLERPVAQVLLTHDDMRNRRRYLNARATLGELLRRGTVPIVNENDTVSVDELKLGDNDNLAAIVAALVDADMLLIASDVDGLYDRDPRGNPDARPVEAVAGFTAELLDSAAGPGSTAGTGGMRTKLEAAQRASRAGIGTALFSGRRPEVLEALAAGRLHGTLVQPGGSRVTVRKHWLHNAPAQPGAILVDPGAALAVVEQGASLLPGGVLGAEDDFNRGDIVELQLRGEGVSRRVARGVSQYSAADVRRIAGHHSRDIDALLGYNYGGTIIHRDDLVLT
ncbi:glutamate 5-kinase [Luteimonas arsenica]|uniref:glutamate 5-kinase n=1 Tax=Luteimonas arsenica TaxID=1586242 RepID=UPI0010561546|nr:glutamate 5-kinase [Luteimonas arsenica]